MTRRPSTTANPTTNPAVSRRALLAATVLAGGAAAGCHVGGRQDAEPSQTPFTPPPEIEALMLSADDVEGAISQTWTDLIPEAASCGEPMTYEIYQIYRGPRRSWNTEADGYPMASVIIETGTATIIETASLYGHPRRVDYRFGVIDQLIHTCDPVSVASPAMTTPRYTSPSPTYVRVPVEENTPIPYDELPDGVIGYTSIQLNADKIPAHHVHRIFASVSSAPTGAVGIISLTTISATTTPATPTPLDLLPTALERAGATLNPDSLATPYPTDAADTADTTDTTTAPEPTTTP